MKRRSIVFIVVFALVTSFIALTHPLAVHAACNTLSGTYPSNGTPFTSPVFSVSAGDTVTATNTPSGGPVTGVGLEITINGFTFPQFGGGGATSASGSVPVNASGTGSVFFLNVSTPGATMHWTISIGTDCGEGEVNQLEFDDGRENSHDGQETAAVYCEDDGGVSIWTVIDSKGYFAFHVTPDELDEIPEYPAKNTLIKSGGGVALYRLTTGELQINSANDYVFIWDGC